MKILILALLLSTSVHATEFPVAARVLPRGTVLAIEDLTWVDLPLARTDAAIADARQLVGQELRRTRNAGEPFRSPDLAPPTLIRRGQNVTLMVSGGGLQLATAGKSLQDGASGATIRVQNLMTQRVIEGRVIDAQTVQVSPLTSLRN